LIAAFGYASDGNGRKLRLTLHLIRCIAPAHARRNVTEADHLPIILRGPGKVPMMR